MVQVTADPSGAPASAATADGPLVIVGKKRTKRQRQAAAVLTEDARCRPVLVRAVITGKARMPRAALEISTPDGSVIGHVAMVNTIEAFDPTLRYWLVGEPVHGATVALVSEGRTQVILPGGRLRYGPADAQPWSDLVCRMLGWARLAAPADAPEAFRAVYADDRATPDSASFQRAADRFRFAAVTVPVIFFAFCFPYLFVIPWAVHVGWSMPTLLALPVLGGGLMTMWSARCRHEVAAQAELIEGGSGRWGKEIAYTQSYWASMRRPSEPWTGPLPAGTR